LHFGVYLSRRSRGDPEVNGFNFNRRRRQYRHNFEARDAGGTSKRRVAKKITGDFFANYVIFKISSKKTIPPRTDKL